MGAARTILSALLRPFGYRVVRASYQERAMELVEADPWSDLTLTPDRVAAALAAPRSPWHYRSDGLASIHNSGFMSDRRFLAAYARGVAAAHGRDEHWYWRVHIGLWAAGTALRVPGDFVECGVNYGCLSSAIMHRHDWNARGRRFWLLDTFGGIDERFLAEDADREGAMAVSKANLALGRYTGDVAAVRRNFSEWDRVEIVQGAVPETLERISSEAIAFVHIDMNSPKPEAEALRFLWPRMTRGGVVLFDDYAYFGGESHRLAIDAVAAELGVEVAHLPTGQGLVIR